MIPTSEQGLPLVEAVEAETGRRPHWSTVMRWCQSPNKHGHRLQSWFIGGRRVTSREAVRRYMEANTAAANNVLPPSTTAQKSKAHADAKRELASVFAE